MYKIPCECGKVHIGETGRCMHERIKQHDRDIRLSRTQTSAVSEHVNKNGHYPLWDEVTFIYRDPHWYSRRVKEAIHITLHPNDLYQKGQHVIRSLPQRTAKGSVSSSHNTDQQCFGPKPTNHERGL